MKEKPLKVGYIRLYFEDGIYKDFKKDDENIGIISADQIKAMGLYKGSEKTRRYSEMTEEEQKLFSGDEWADFREDENTTSDISTKTENLEDQKGN